MVSNTQVQEKPTLQTAKAKYLVWEAADRKAHHSLCLRKPRTAEDCPWILTVWFIALPTTVLDMNASVMPRFSGWGRRRDTKETRHIPWALSMRKALRLTHHVSVNSYDPVRQVISPFYTWKNWGTKWLSGWPSIAQQVNDRPGFTAHFLIHSCQPTTLQPLVCAH